MGNAKIYYYPPTGSTETKLATIDLGAVGLSFIDDYQVRSQDNAVSFTGQPTVVTYLSYQAVEIRIDIIKDPTVARDLQVLEVALKRGAILSLAEDADHAVAAFASVQPAATDTSVRLEVNQFANFESSPAWSTGDFVSVQGPSPGGKRELVTATAGYDAATSTLSCNQLKFDYEADPWCFVHSRGFWPYLMLPPSRYSDNLLQPINYRLAWSFRATLYEVPAVVARAGLQYFDEQWKTDPSDTGDPSFYSLLGRERGLIGGIGTIPDGGPFDPSDPAGSPIGSDLGGGIGSLPFRAF